MDGVTYATQEEADAAAKKKHEADETTRKTELVRLARQRFAMAEEAEAEIRRLADEDIKFRAGQQWDPVILKDRELDKRPALVINRIPQFERQITNEQRQSKPSVRVSPVDSGADPDTAEVLQGLIRHIEYDSNADVAYDTALTSAVRGGLGYIRLISEFEYEDSFDQCLKVKRVRDPFSVYMDPSHQEPDGSDANWAFVVGDGISKEQFKEEYPDSKPVTGGWGDRETDGEGTCQVVEYFYRERVKDQLLEVQAFTVDQATGQPIEDGPPTTALRSSINDDDFARMKVLSSRDTHRIKVCWAKIAGSEVVAETEFPSKWIPVVPVLGDELWVDGKRVLEGVVRHAKDPQRMYNYWSTAITETIALAPKAPWVGYEGQFAGHEKKWALAARKNVPYLEVRPITIGGAAAPLPQRNSFDAPIAAMTQAMMFASDDMKATTGIYDASLGNSSAEKTGVAIRARQNQSQTSTVHYSDNLARALRHLGRILIDAMPRVYDSPRVIRILGEDQTEKMVAINGHPPTPATKGQQKPFDIGTGRYDVTVDMGPSYTSKRQEAVAASMELSRSNPQIAQMIADLMVRNMDWPGAKEMADRLKKMLPPGIAEPDPEQMKDPAILMQQMQGLSQQHEQLVRALHAAHNTMDSKALELQSAERKDLIARHTNLATAFAAADPEDEVGRALLLRELHALGDRLDTYFAPAPGAPQGS